MEEMEDRVNIEEQEAEPVVVETGKESPFVNSPFETTPVQVQKTACSKSGRKGLKIFLKIIAAVLAVCFVIGCCGATAVLSGYYWRNRMNHMNADLQGKIDNLQAQVSVLEKTQIIIPENENGEAVTMTPTQLYAVAVRGVVAVSTGSSFGTGFFISSDGYIVTNYHVVEDASSIKIATYVEKQYTAKLVGYDNANDLALLKIDAKDMPYLEIGSSNVNVGDQVVTIGNPLGELTNSLTIGYISAKNRVVVSEGNKINMLQIDATINSGNSGGPLLNMQGQVIGITSAKYSGTTSSGTMVEGIGFAIPMDDVTGILADLKEYGYVNTPYLGVAVRDVENSVIQSYGLPSGAYVDSVVAGVSAARAGVKAKDIIVAVGEHKVTSVTDLTRALRNFKAGDTTTITVYRAGAELQLSITLDEKPRG